MHTFGESLWFPTVHRSGRSASAWQHIDERFLEGRRRHILEEYHKLGKLHSQQGGAEILIVGAGFIGVEWATEIGYYFSEKIGLTIIDFLPRCLGPLPDSAAEYCSNYMHATGIQEFYQMKHPKAVPGVKPDSVPKEDMDKFYSACNLPNGPHEEYSCVGVKASNYYLEHTNCLSFGGPGGGRWISINRYLQVTERPANPIGPDNRTPLNPLPKYFPEGKLWGKGRVFAVGDCNAGGIGDPRTGFLLNPIPKISYPGEEQAMHACMNIEILDKAIYGGPCCVGTKLKQTWWPWGAGMFATSLGPHDACFVVAATHEKHSGYMVNWWIPAALQKELIETTKVNEMKDGCLGVMLWHFVHHTPCNCWGKGPCCPGTCPWAFNVPGLCCCC